MQRTNKYIMLQPRQVRYEDFAVQTKHKSNDAKSLFLLYIGFKLSNLSVHEKQETLSAQQVYYTTSTVTFPWQEKSKFCLITALSIVDNSPTT